MSFWSILKTVGKLLLNAFVALLAWLAITNSPLWPRDAGAAPQEKHDEHQKIEPDADKHDSKHGGTTAVGAHGEKHESGQHDPHPLHHVMDDPDKWELFTTFGPSHIVLPGKVIEIPFFGGLTIDVFISKFVILEAIACLLICAVYIPLAKKVQSGGVTRGSFGNFFEVLLTFIRDQVAKPSIGEHDADKYVPFLWTLFLFILFNNLLGMVPMGGSPTSSIYVTAGLALVVFGYMHFSGIAKLGFGHYIGSLWPHMDIPLLLWPIKLLIFLLEWMGVLVRNLVLAVRLFANMMAGHTVLAVILIFIFLARNTSPFLWSSITLASVLGIVTLSLLELFVAFLQAYIFTFLTALFMGMALHPEH